MTTGGLLFLSEGPPTRTEGPPISTEGPPLPTGGLLIPQYEAFCFFAILHLSFSSFGKRFCRSAKVVRFKLISNFRGGNATPASRQGWQSATPAPMVAPPLIPRYRRFEHDTFSTRNSFQATFE